MKQAVELYPGIVSDLTILGGKPIVENTRVPVVLVLAKLAAGMSMDEVMYEYYLSVDNLRAALGYAAQQVAEKVFIRQHFPEDEQ